MQHYQQQQFDQGGRRPEGRATIRNFMGLNPRPFQATDEPLDADDWLREVNRTLNNARVAEEDKVGFATHILRGETAAWWEHYLEMRPAGSPPLMWANLTAVFREHHISESVMERKKQEFCTLTQGSKTVSAYSRAFTRLARYGGDEASTDEKMQKRFRNSLSLALKYALTHVPCKTFEKLVDIAIKEETGRQAFEESRKHAKDLGSTSTPPAAQKRRMWVSTAPTSTPQRPALVPA
jgi:hypothetical protein